MSARLPVLVVDDSPLCVDVLASRIGRDPRLTVAGVAYDGLRAVELARTLRPAVITMDLHMPKLDGLGAIERIVRERPTRILVVTARGDRGTLAFESLRRGASDLMEKPRLDDPACLLCDRIWALARAPIGAPSARPARMARVSASTPIAAIGVVASTGGPAALAALLGALPRDLAAPIIVVQHLPTGFAERLAKWLDGISPLTVSIAAEGEALAPGKVLIAGDDRHLTIDAQRRVRLLAGPALDGHRPSGSRLLLSLASELGSRAAGVVLTGMGRDGADGLLALRRSGGRTLVQDEATSAVYGMPRASLGAAEASVPLGALPAALVGLAGRTG